MNNKVFTMDTEEKLTPELLKKAIDWNDKQNKQTIKKRKYYNGENELDRTRPNFSKSAKVMVNNAKYITDLNTAHLLGNPVQYQAETAEEIEDILSEYQAQAIATLDREIAKEISIVGKAYEFIYSDEDANPRSTRPETTNAFIIYDNTVAQNKLYGIVYRGIYKNGKDTPEYYELQVVDAEHFFRYKMKGSNLELLEKKQHGFGKVPMIEYINNPERQGDFEPVLTLIDAYNILQSDRINDREALVDAILIAYGATLDQEDVDSIREERVITGIPKDAKIEYLVKQLNETDIEVLRKSIEQDIHKISMTPNLSDQEFAGNASGVAIGFKLHPFEQHIRDKEGYFERGLLERIEIYAQFLKTKSKISLPDDWNKSRVDVIFNRNLPKNDAETADTIQKLDGIVDRETLISQLSFVKNAHEILEALADQEAELKPAPKPQDFNGEEFGKEPEPTDPAEQPIEQ